MTVLVAVAGLSTHLRALNHPTNLPTPARGC
jgi:hypothetical protein